MNSKPQQIKMQSTKKGAVTKREDGVTAAGMAAGGPAAGDEAPSTAAAPLTPTALQPLVSEENTIFIFAIYVMVSCVGGRVLWSKSIIPSYFELTLPQEQIEIQVVSQQES